ncbi:MAG: methyl-accepting chemotaxis protein [Pseudomonadota bacterium]
MSGLRRRALLAGAGLAGVFTIATALQIVIQFVGQNALASWRSAEYQDELQVAWLETVEIVVADALRIEIENLTLQARALSEGQAPGVVDPAGRGVALSGRTSAGGPTPPAEALAAARAAGSAFFVTPDGPYVLAHAGGDAFGYAPAAAVFEGLSAGAWRFGAARMDGTALSGDPAVAVRARPGEAFAAEVDGSPLILAGVALNDADGAPLAIAFAGRDDAARAAQALRIEVISYGAAVLWVIGACAFSYFRSRRILAPLNDVAVGLERLGDGDMGAHVVYDRDDEIGRIADTFEKLRDRLEQAEEIRAGESAREADAQTRRRADLLAMASQLEAEIDKASRSAKDRANGMSGASVEMSALAKRSGDAAERMRGVAEQTRAAAGAAGAAAQSLTDATASIESQTAAVQASVDRAAQDSQAADAVVGRLGEASARIVEVVATIGEIADQTRLLALNATIEAARAGEARRGFAVVAAEVKSLADQSAGAAEEVRVQVDGVRAAAGDVVGIFEEMGRSIADVQTNGAAIAGGVADQRHASQAIGRVIDDLGSSAEQMDAEALAVHGAAQQTRGQADDVRDRSAELAREFESFSEHMASTLRESAAGDRRTERRVALDADAELVIDGVRRPAKTVDVSLHGARLTPVDGVNPDARGELRLGDAMSTIEIVGVDDESVRIRVVGDGDLSAAVAAGEPIRDRRAHPDAADDDVAFAAQ